MEKYSLDSYTWPFFSRFYFTAKLRANDFDKMVQLPPKYNSPHSILQVHCMGHFRSDMRSFNRYLLIDHKWYFKGGGT